MNLKERIKLFISSLAITASEFEKRCGLGNGYVNNIRVSISDQKLEQISKAFPQLNPVWLKMGEGTMLIGEQNRSTASIGIPLVPIEALAGNGSGEFVIQNTDIEDRYIIPEFNKADFLIRVKGSSMYPKYSAGDILACMRVGKSKFIQWNKAYVIDTDQGVMVKRIIKAPDENKWILRSENKDYQDITINPDEDIHHISLVIGVIRFE
ncbi:MAG TPA: hypothetical protein DIW47_10995 [Bacteroidetes bacterium]|nr:hypothetical protein [Bacteroidota bacterium]